MVATLVIAGSIIFGAAVVAHALSVILYARSPKAVTQNRLHEFARR